MTGREDCRRFLESEMAVTYAGKDSLFRKPKVRKGFLSCVSSHGVSHLQWDRYVKQLNEVLLMAYFPIWLWVLGAIMSAGLLGLAVIIWQARATRKAAVRLAEVVDEMNKDMKDIERRVWPENPERLLRFQIPRPSIPGVIVMVEMWKKADELRVA